MFDSGITASTLISDLKNEIDVALDIPDMQYVEWLNSTEQLLYTEIIKEQKAKELTPDTACVIDLADIEVDSSEEKIRYEDIYAVFADTTQLKKTTLTSGHIFPDTWFKTENKLGYSIAKNADTIKIIYFVKPKLKSVDDTDGITGGNVKIPIEFIDLIKAKLRGEAYKLANETASAAIWLNDYNSALENFKAWVSAKSPDFGM